jgi:hypothetical protein
MILAIPDLVPSVETLAARLALGHAGLGRGALGVGRAALGKLPAQRVVALVLMAALRLADLAFALPILGRLDLRDRPPLHRGELVEKVSHRANRSERRCRSASASSPR